MTMILQSTTLAFNDYLLNDETNQCRDTSQSPGHKNYISEGQLLVDLQYTSKKRVNFFLEYPLFDKEFVMVSF